MSLVTLGDRAKALQMLGSGSARRDRMLLSLAGQTSWTDGQRTVIELLWADRARRLDVGRAASTRQTPTHS